MVADEKTNKSNSSLLLRRTVWVPALSSGGYQHTQNPLWGEDFGYQIGFHFISAKGIQISICKKETLEGNDVFFTKSGQLPLTAGTTSPKL